MSTETHTEAGGLVEVIHAATAYTQPGKGLVPLTVAQADAALSWLTARLTDDDVVDAAIAAVGPVLDRNLPGWDADQTARAALAAAAAVIGGAR